MMSLEVECKLCGEEYDMRHDGCPACWWRAHKRVPELETTNAALLEALEKIAGFGINQARPSSDLLLVQIWATEAIRKAKEA